MNNDVENTTETLKQEPAETNESAGFYLSTHLKITDPNSKEILVQMRGD